MNMAKMLAGMVMILVLMTQVGVKVNMQALRKILLK